MRKIPLTRGKFAIVDDSDYEWLVRNKWCASRMGSINRRYAVRTIWDSDRKHSHQQSMHRLILGLDLGDKRECDHIDGDGLNNQRANLRICSHRQNSYNQKGLPNSNSIYRGVYLSHEKKPWRACIYANKPIHLGYFHFEKEAAQAYDEAAKKHFGEFAKLNS